MTTDEVQRKSLLIKPKLRPKSQQPANFIPTKVPSRRVTQPASCLTYETTRIRPRDPVHNNEIPGQNSKLLVPHTSGNTNSAHNTMGDPKDPMKTATTTCTVRPRKMQRNPRETHTNYEVKCQETFVYAEGYSTTNSGRNTAREMIQICPAKNAETKPGKWTRDSGGAPSSGQTLPSPTRTPLLIRR